MYKRNFALTLEESEVQTEPNKMTAFDLLFFYGGLTLHEMLNLPSDSWEEIFTAFATINPPSETIDVIKSSLEIENFTKVKVSEDINKIRSEHYNKKQELQLEIEFNIICLEGSDEYWFITASRESGEHKVFLEYYRRIYHRIKHLRKQ